MAIQLKQLLKKKRKEAETDSDYIKELERLLSLKVKNREVLLELADATCSTPNRPVELIESDYDIHINVAQYTITLQNYEGDFELSIVDKIIDNETHRLALPCIDIEPVFKSINAKRVLSLMDSCEDGQDRYLEFVLLVANEAGVTREAVEAEVSPFI
jgi:hypothetical protein